MAMAATMRVPAIVLPRPLRFFFGPGYRVYFAQKGNQIMLLLAGGDKTGQDKTIKEAQKMLESLIKEGQW